MLRRRVVKAALGAALGVTAVPGRGVDGKDERPARRSLRHEEGPEPVPVDPAALERLVEAAVRAAELGLEAEGGHRSDRAGDAQDRIGQLEEGVAPAPATGTESLSEPDQLTHRTCTRWLSCHDR